MASYDKSKIGKRIGRGFDRSVFMYGDDKVIKFSTLGKFAPRKLAVKMRTDYDICKKYFGDFVLETIDVSDPAKNEHVEVQPYVCGEALSKKHLKDEQVRKKFIAMVDCLDRLIADGYPQVDLMGGKGLFVPELSNVIIDQKGDLFIVDATLHEGKSVRPIGYLIDISFPIVRMIQEYRIKMLLG